MQFEPNLFVDDIFNDIPSGSTFDNEKTWKIICFGLFAALIVVVLYCNNRKDDIIEAQEKTQQTFVHMMKLIIENQRARYKLMMQKMLNEQNNGLDFTTGIGMQNTAGFIQQQHRNEQDIQMMGGGNGNPQDSYINDFEQGNDSAGIGY